MAGNVSSESSGPQQDSSSGPDERQDPAPARKLETVILMTTLCLAVFLAALDVTIVTTALPTISDHFHSPEGYSWIGSSFLLAAAVVAPNWGKCSDIWGRKSILLIAIAVFFLGSALCGAAVSLSMLLVGRTVQGAAAGGLFSLVNIVIGDLFSQRDRGKYYGIVGLVWALAFTLGPLIGGALTQGVSWRWCFYINLPISGATFVAIAFLLKLHTPRTPFMAGVKAIDWAGSIALIGGSLMFLLGLEFGGTTHPWGSATVICLIVFGASTVVLFVVIERYVAHYPIVPAHLYANASNLAVLVVNLFHGIIFTTNTYFLPLYCQSVLQASPLLSGVLLLPFAASMSIATVGTGVYLEKTGRYLDCVRVGFVLLVLGSGLEYDLPDSRYWPKVILYQVVPAFGVGLNFQPPLIAIQSNVPAQDNGAVTASFGLVRNIASAVGVVVGSVIFTNQMNTQQQGLADALGSQTAGLFSGGNAQANVFLVDTFDSATQAVIRRAFWESMRNIWIVAACLAAGGLLVCLFIKRNTLNRTHVEVKTGLAGEEERRKILLSQRTKKEQNDVEGNLRGNGIPLREN